MKNLRCDGSLDVKKDQPTKGGLTLTPAERADVAAKDETLQAVDILGLTEEEVAFGIQYAAGPHMGHQQHSYKAAFPEATDNYASSRSSDLMKRERVQSFIKMAGMALIERLIVQGDVDRLEDWKQDALEAKAILRAARRRQIKLTSVESANLQYAINRALGSPVQVADVTHRDERATIEALTRYAARVESDRRRQGGELLRALP